METGQAGGQAAAQAGTAVGMVSASVGAGRRSVWPCATDLRRLRGAVSRHAVLSRRPAACSGAIDPVAGQGRGLDLYSRARSLPEVLTARRARSRKQRRRRQPGRRTTRLTPSLTRPRRRSLQYGNHDIDVVVLDRAEDDIAVDRLVAQQRLDALT